MGRIANVTENDKGIILDLLKSGKSVKQVCVQLKTSKEIVEKVVGIELRYYSGGRSKFYADVRDAYALKMSFSDMCIMFDAEAGDLRDYFKRFNIPMHFGDEETLTEGISIEQMDRIEVITYKDGCINPVSKASFPNIFEASKVTKIPVTKILNCIDTQLNVSRTGHDTVWMSFKKVKLNESMNVATLEEMFKVEPKDIIKTLTTKKKNRIIDDSERLRIGDHIDQSKKQYGLSTLTPEEKNRQIDKFPGAFIAGPKSKDVPIDFDFSGLYSPEPEIIKNKLKVGLVVKSIAKLEDWVVILEVTREGAVVIANEPSLREAMRVAVLDTADFDKSTVYRRIREDDVKPYNGYIFASAGTVSKYI